MRFLAVPPGTYNNCNIHDTAREHEICQDFPTRELYMWNTTLKKVDRECLPNRQVMGRIVISKISQFG